MLNPSRPQADQILQDASNRNPGPWVAHSQEVAKAAEAIAAQHHQLCPQDSYVLGLLHDIGRREGVTDMRHVLDGYQFLVSAGFPDAARICLTHSFPVPNISYRSGHWDCSASELEFIQKFLDQAEYGLYDRLIQLCDAICLPTGAVIMEKRLLDVTLRHGFNEFTLPKWRAFLQIKADFETAIGKSIYAILPGVAQNTFGFEI